MSKSRRLFTVQVGKITETKDLVQVVNSCYFLECVQVCETYSKLQPHILMGRQERCVWCMHARMSSVFCVCCLYAHVLTK